MTKKTKIEKKEIVQTVEVKAEVFEFTREEAYLVRKVLGRMSESAFRNLNPDDSYFQGVYREYREKEKLDNYDRLLKLYNELAPHFED